MFSFLQKVILVTLYICFLKPLAASPIKLYKLISDFHTMFYDALKLKRNIQEIN